MHMLKKNLFAIIVILGLAAYTYYDLEIKNKKDDIETVKTYEKETLSQTADNRAKQEETTTPTGNTGINQGDFAPDFKMRTLDGKEAKLSDYKGKKVVLNLWASWCPPCKAEMPHMQAYYEKNKEKMNVEILAVNLTTLEKNKDNVGQFVQDNKLKFPILLDETGDIGMEYQAYSIPTTYMINSTGVIQRKIIGPMDEEMLTDMVKSLE